MWRFPEMGVPLNQSKSSISFSGFPWNKPTSYWGNPIDGNRPTFSVTNPVTVPIDAMAFVEEKSPILRPNHQ